MTHGAALHCQIEGPADAPAVVFSNSLGTDFRIWDAVVAELAQNYRVLRYDKRGHGLSDDPDTGWAMHELVTDAATLMDHFGLSNAAFVGLSVGGLIAQGLAAERPDLVRLLVLADTAARIGNDDLWNDRIAQVKADGLGSMADAILERWFAPEFHHDGNFAMWRNMLVRTTDQGYARVSAAIRDTDVMESTSRLTQPTLAVVGDRDGATPPDLVRETAELISGSRFSIIRGAGHLPCVEKPQVFTQLLRGFFGENGHV
ncbi:3-oxoadipate enol-lactonase [Amylibacter sp. IMCC11727]|uniref:3-oxoadipate enol-lactonase n=1 Tax=Amylibacter sp. IMCC11727 TaxID=3039851 RepID=UPI00244DAF5A|nr:3-oxoadipate enol-lactonase [Amylibacter sp. IMCC11727]WGI21394.1 3-oxoadipate enol-lactonase [Amylibacter sp. IMCC11727]